MMKAYAIGIGGTALAATFFAAGVYSAKTPPIGPDIVMAEPAADAAMDAAIRDFLERHPEVVVEASQRHAQLEEQRKSEIITATLQERRGELIGDASSPILGDPAAKITLVEFFDYNCGFCRRGHEDINAVLEEFPDVKVVLRPFPILGPDSARAHQVAQAFFNLHPDKYRALHDALLTSPGQVDEATALQIALSLGADEAVLRAEMGKPEIGEAFSRTYAITQALDITGTPSYVLGMEVIGGAVGFDTLAEKIRAIAVASN
jgi:protein-disulfide isomerase